MFKRLGTKAKSGNNQGATVESSALALDLSSPNFNLPIFHYLVVAKNTGVLSYTSYILNLPKGAIQRIWIEYPKGCAGLVGFQLWREARQIFPLPYGVWLRSDGITLSFAFTHEIVTNPFWVEIRAYNLDDTYQHTIWIGLEMRGLYADITPEMQGFINYMMGG
jgi:hypothetical protein